MIDLSRVALARWRKCRGTQHAILYDMTYDQAKGEAQRKADTLGFDHGVEACYGGYSVFMLPAKRYRMGHELRCEVVSATDLRTCRNGHGPCAES